MMPVDLDTLMIQHRRRGSRVEVGRYQLIVVLETWDPAHEIWEAGPFDTRVLMQSNSLHRTMAQAHDLIASTDEISGHLAGRMVPDKSFPYVQVFIGVWDTTDSEEVDLIDIENLNQGAVATFMDHSFAKRYVDALIQIYGATR